MTIIITTLCFLLVSFSVGTITGYLIAFGMGTNYDEDDVMDDGF